MRLIQWSREPDRDFMRNLKEFNDSFAGPDVFFVWNPHPIFDKDGKAIDQEPRWEIWVELREVSHPDARNTSNPKTDRQFEGHGWARKLQTWCHRNHTFHDDGYAGLDCGVFNVLREANTWRNRRFFEEKIVEAGEKNDAALLRDRQSLVKDTSRYYKDFDRTLVAPHGRGRSGDWRYRNR